MSTPARAAAAALLILFATGAILLWMGQPAICTCGMVELWVDSAGSARTSQMLADWYSLSHIIHGFLFYGFLWLVARRWPVEWRFVAALVIEAGWEIVENTPMVIDRYREATIAVGYAGDSVVNSFSDIAMMAIGFVAAARLPLWASAAAVLLLEIAASVAIRDNLTLNIWMLLAPNEAIRGWQAGG